MLNDCCRIGIFRKNYHSDITASITTREEAESSGVKTPIFSAELTRSSKHATAKLIRMTRSENFSFLIENLGPLFGELLRKSPYNSGF